MPVTFYVQDCYPGITRLLANRVIPTSTMAYNIRKAILELAEDYPFPLLQQTTNPLIQLVVGQNAYPYNTFFAASDDGPDMGIFEFNKIDGFFIYNDYPNVPTYPPTSGNYNSGYLLRYKTIDAIQILLNQSTLPAYWSRYADLVYIAATPDKPYYVYMLYSKQHPFPNSQTNLEGTDPIYLPSSWQDIVEFSAAERCAIELRLYDMASEFHTAVYGDPKFQLTGGTEGAPGLIFKRTSQLQRDQTTSSKAMKVKLSRYMR